MESPAWGGWGGRFVKIRDNTWLDPVVPLHGDYRPQLKRQAGERIARWALATQYSFEHEVQWKPPMLVEMERQDGSLRRKLDADVSDPQDGAIQGFAIAGEDRQFHPADVAYAEKGKDGRGRIQYDRK